MKYIYIPVICSVFLISSCNSSEDSKIKELESKLEQQQEVINKTKEDKLLKEIEAQQKEIEALKNQGSKTTVSYESNFFAKGKGSFPEGSDRILTNDDLYNLSSRDLKIMRNEIFARHGYIFKTADMINHFSNESWFKPLYNDVTNKLSYIEKTNVNFIKTYE
jgi:hypothetical protein